MPHLKALLTSLINQGVSSYLWQTSYDVENLNDYPDLPEVAETGMTFEENARLKAETISQLTGKMVLADDSGLKVDVLGGLPGVWSAVLQRERRPRKQCQTLAQVAMVFELKDRSAIPHNPGCS